LLAELGATIVLGNVACKKHGVSGATSGPAIRLMFLAHAHVADSEISTIGFDVIHTIIVKNAVRTTSHVG
jgi:hypothetical protein